MKQMIIFFYLTTFAFFIAACDSQTPRSANEQKKLTADSLLTLVQKQTFEYFWSGAEPTSGLARERFHVDGDYPDNDQNVITIGGSGFGVMAILVGIERGFITRKKGFERLDHIVDYLEKADRFHGVWPHWLQGETGKVKPFSAKDDGADLVESAYMIQGLLAVRQYFSGGNDAEKQLSKKIDRLWREVEWDWFRKDDENVLYWHWSPNFGWDMNFAVTGYNECLIMYVLAASSPTHSIPPQVYHDGWARGGDIVYGGEKYGRPIALSHNYAEEWTGPLFWAHYSYLGLDPRNLKDQYADYWQHNVSHASIHYHYAVDNPKEFEGYGENCWGLTSSYSLNFYAGHKPWLEDFGVISPTAALSSFPYTPEYSMKALEFFYYDLGDKLFGPFGFYDAFSIQENWFPQRYLAIDQGPIVVMIENYRSGLLWDLFMSCPEIVRGLGKLGFEYK